jgi:hypothetical protein
MTSNGPGTERSPGILEGNLPSQSGKSYRCDAKGTPRGRLPFTTYFFCDDRSSSSERQIPTGTWLQGPAPNGLRRGRDQGSLDGLGEHLLQAPPPLPDSPRRASRTSSMQANINGQPSISVESLSAMTPLVLTLPPRSTPRFIPPNAAHNRCANAPSIPTAEVWPGPLG